ncbi:SPOR domain-containing protein [Beggiatoa leptomitoformis]|uniref:SPOR domain-containing protein n=1 Tax=Beggiatoa leptomitoformis TaxID=288004 RepID=A0A2N9YFG5_9GAMM|nr:SPOR domain-containing protein [Beggiatoa leptomitoformis]AUI69238.1 hypothetical protein BLE401_11385 [Beggiatoa leptomitoformis]QGX03745.1 hypothetical protein AL038_19180 [Beggiatoa leptomitoformis]
MAGNQRRLRREDVQSCPPWAWFLGGILLGIFLSFLVYLREIAPYLTHAPTTETPPSDSSKATDKPEKSPTSVAATPPATVVAAEKRPVPPTHFEFYDVLKQPSVLQTTTQANDNNSLAEEATPPTVQTPGTYLLQAGSFRDKREAEGLKVHLASLGLIANIEEAALDNTGVWYRVRLGPFDDLTILNQVRNQLTASNITSVVLRF